MSQSPTPTKFLSLSFSEAYILFKLNIVIMVYNNILHKRQIGSLAIHTIKAKVNYCVVGDFLSTPIYGPSSIMHFLKKSHGVWYTWVEQELCCVFIAIDYQLTISQQSSSLFILKCQKSYIKYPSLHTGHTTSILSLTNRHSVCDVVNTTKTFPGAFAWYTAQRPRPAGGLQGKLFKWLMPNLL